MCIISVHTPKYICLSVCRAASALRTSGMTYIPLFYVRPNIYDYAKYTDTSFWHDALDIIVSISIITANVAVSINVMLFT
jgi:hypothetical protein